MIYNVYWVSHDYPFDIFISEVDSESEEASGYGSAEYIGKSAVKAEIVSRQNLIEYIQNNNDYNGTKIFTTIYINMLKEELDGIIDEFPEDTI